MTRVGKFQVAGCSIALLLLAGISIYVAVSMRNFISPPPQIYEEASIPSEFSHYFDESGIPPTATDIRLYYDPSLRGGYWLRARLKQDELPSFTARHEHIDKADTLESLAAWLPESVAAWWPLAKTDDMTVFEYDPTWFVIVDQATSFVYVMKTED